MNPSFHIVLYQPEIPPNTGNIMRLCSATNSILHLIHPLGFRFDDKAMKRAAMDYAENVDIRQWKDWEEFMAGEKPARLFFIETKTDQYYTEARFVAGDYLVFGRESKGLPDSLLEQFAGQTIKIPMFNEHARSLNLANSVAIVLYEAIRQQGK
ncbi:MAG: tRNA (cytidine(34)-2'-O)-methyltransferase [Verrucomicrobiota bacterium]|nr:tRNA (cytidine(34)-2'-O)-methyltransferase [Verrucomicrobiota bacterium]